MSRKEENEGKAYSRRTKVIYVRRNKALIFLDHHGASLVVQEFVDLVLRVK